MVESLAYLMFSQEESTGHPDDIDTDEAWNDETLFLGAWVLIDPDDCLGVEAERYPELLIERTLGGL